MVCRPSRKCTPVARRGHLDLASAATSACLMRKIRFVFQHLAHAHAIQLLIHLRARRPHRRPAAGIQQPELNPHGIGQFPHQRRRGRRSRAPGGLWQCRRSPGLQDICAIRSRFIVTMAVCRPIRAHARAASHPACPAPITTTSYFSCIVIIVPNDEILIIGRRRARARPGMEAGAVAGVEVFATPGNPGIARVATCLPAGPSPLDARRRDGRRSDGGRARSAAGCRRGG